MARVGHKAAVRWAFLLIIVGNYPILSLCWVRYRNLTRLHERRNDLKELTFRKMCASGARPLADDRGVKTMITANQNDERNTGLFRPRNVGIFDSKIRVLIVDDHELMRQMMSDVLAMDDSIEVIGRARNGEEALALIEQLSPDVVVLDLAMPGANGIDVAAAIRERGDQPVLMVSIHAQPYLVRRARRAGAQGYLPKLSLVRTLAPAIHALCEGQPYFGEDNRWQV